MSQGRSNLRQPRAPVEAQHRRADQLSSVVQPTGDPFRIGPGVLRSSHQWHEHGILHEQAGDYKAAIRCYRAALAIDPVDTQILFDLAYALAESGNVEAAIERYRQITEIHPTHQDAWVNLGDLLVTAGHDKEGIAAMRRAVQLNPSDFIARHNLDSISAR